MRFNPKARLERGRVRDAGRGSGGGLPGGSTRGIPIPGGLAGGGIGGILIVILIVVINQFIGGGGSNPLGTYSNSRLTDSGDSGRYDECKTGEDANQSQD